MPERSRWAASAPPRFRSPAPSRSWACAWWVSQSRCAARPIRADRHVRLFRRNKAAALAAFFLVLAISIALLIPFPSTTFFARWPSLGRELENLGHPAAFGVLGWAWARFSPPEGTIRSAGMAAALIL